jgi:hypothetical protein
MVDTVVGAQSWAEFSKEAAPKSRTKSFTGQPSENRKPIYQLSEFHLQEWKQFQQT